MFTTKLNLENLDFSKTCRLCLTQNKELVSISDMSSFELQYSIVICGCTGVMVSEKDKLPKGICLECVDCLNKFYQFRKLVVNSERCLQDFLDKSQNKHIENVDNGLEDILVNVSNEKPTCSINDGDVIYILEQNSEVEEKLNIIENDVTTFPVKNEEAQDSEIESIVDIANEGLEINENKTNTDKLHNLSDKPYICKQCGKSFTRKQSVQRHKIIHTGEKPFSCKICGKSFNQLSIVKRHEKFHTGEKPYICDRCNKGFSLKAHLQQHMRTHTGERPYKCKQCKRSFTELSHLIRHNAIHNRKCSVRNLMGWNDIYGKKLLKCWRKV